MTDDCPRDLPFPWQPYFDRHVLQNFNLSQFKNEMIAFLWHFFKVLDHFMMFLFVFITSDSILGDFLTFLTNPEIQDGGPRWSPFRNNYAIITSCDVIALWCRRERRQFQTYCLPSKSHCHSFYILGVTQEGGNPPPRS